MILSVTMTILMLLLLEDLKGLFVCFFFFIFQKLISQNFLLFVYILG